MKGHIGYPKKVSKLLRKYNPNVSTHAGKKTTLYDILFHSHNEIVAINGVDKKLYETSLQF